MEEEKVQVVNTKFSRISLQYDSAWNRFEFWFMRKQNLELCQVCKTDWALHARCRTSKKSQEIHTALHKAKIDLYFSLFRGHTHGSTTAAVTCQCSCSVSEGLSHTDALPNHSSPSPQILPLCIKRPHYTFIIFSFKFWLDQWNYQCVSLRYFGRQERSCYRI